MSFLDAKIILTNAVGRGDRTEVSGLLEKAFQPFPRSIFDSTPLLAAAEGDHHKMVCRF